MLASGLSSPAYKATGLVAGTMYEFKVLSRNSYSYSSQSEAIALLCAFVPEPPLSVITANNNDLVTISWGESITNGSPIIAYKVFVRQQDDTTFTEENIECVGTNQIVISS